MRRRLVQSLLRQAWPTASIDRLLRATLLADEGAAAAAWRAFEAAADFDRLDPAELDLLGRVAPRLALLAPDSPMRGRIGGIARARWSRAQLALAEAGIGLRRLALASVETLVSEAAPAPGGVAVLVRPEAFPRAFDLLIEGGWLPPGTGGAEAYRKRLATIREVHLVRGRTGSLELRRALLRPPYAAVDDGPIWARAFSGAIAGSPVRLPSPTDRLAVALAYGAFDPRHRAEWLARAAEAIDAGVDWALLEALVEERGLQAPAAIVLGYLGARLERGVPVALLRRCEAGAAGRPVTLLVRVAQARPHGWAGALLWLPRIAAAQRRALLAYRARRVDLRSA